MDNRWKKAKSTVVPRLSLKSKEELEAIFLNAVEISNIDTMKDCIEVGVNVNIYNIAKDTALHMVAEKGDIRLAFELLKAKDINLNLKNLLGNTPLLLACILQKRKLAKLLLRMGADPNISDRFGRTPLHMAATLGLYRLTVDLIKFGADVNAISVFGNTPLTIAIIDQKNLSIAEFLIEKGADCNLSGRNCPLFLETCLHCKDRFSISFVELLLTAGTDINMTDPLTSRNCMHIVALTGYLPLAEYLLVNGADPNIVDKSRRTALNIAIDHRNYNIVRLLAKSLVGVTLDDIKINTDVSQSLTMSFNSSQHSHHLSDT